jgi:hypothetical protein
MQKPIFIRNIQGMERIKRLVVVKVLDLHVIVNGREEEMLRTPEEDCFIDETWIYELFY